ncbi:MAG: M15 family metallopeptidase [Betaproteobacteria bacterium]|nr:M15 family metallopeptidase [Betaproteobacteria bacterium]
MLNELELTGRARTHVVQRDDLAAALQRDTLAAFLAMKRAAESEGFGIEIVSSFRDFAAQQAIWDRKYRGERPLYDAHGNVRKHATLTAAELIDAIVCWSAVPGGSRHHWGTEIDVIDRAAVPEGYRVRLLPEETRPGGIFHRLHQWLDGNMARFGFFRPYCTFRGGVLPEPWHLSYAPVSTGALRALTLEIFEEAVRASSILGRSIVLQRVGDLYERYVANVDAPEFPGRQSG